MLAFFLCLLFTFSEKKVILATNWFIWRRPSLCCGYCHLWDEGVGSCGPVRCGSGPAVGDQLCLGMWELILAVPTQEDACLTMCILST